MGLEQLLEESARRTPDKAAVVCGPARCSYRQLDEQANRLAHALIGAGVEAGDRVAICLENSVNTIASIFAVLKTGAVFVVINPQTSTVRLTHVLADCGAAALIARSEQIASLGDAWPRLAHVKAAFAAG